MKAIALGFTVVVMAAGVAWADGDDVRRVTPLHRPYIVEIGEPTQISCNQLRREMRRNNDLNDYISFYGLPEVAEVQDVRPEYPWDAYEVRLFYLHRDIEIAFGRAFVAPWVRDFGVVKYAGHIQPQDRRRLAGATYCGEGGEGDPLTRLTNAADRAARAAERAEASSEAAVRSADRAARVTDQMESDFHRNLWK